MQRPSRYSLIGSTTRRVLEHVAKTGNPARIEAFNALVEQLLLGPLPTDGVVADIRPLKPESLAGGYSAPFEGGLLTYQVFVDYPRIRLVYVTWLAPGLTVF